MRRLLPGLVLLLCCLSYNVHAQLNKYYYYYIGQNYIVDSKYQDAIETLNTLLRFDDTAYEGFFLRGIAKYNLRDLVGAESDFSRAIELNPVYTQAYWNRAMTRSQLGMYEGALDDYDEALDLRPDYVEVYYGRAVTYLVSEQFDKAIEDFNYYLRKEPHAANGYINRAVAYLGMKDTVSALADFGRAIELNPYNPETYSRRALIHMDREEYGEALADFNTAIENDPDHLISYFNRGLLYSETDRPVEAVADFDVIIGMDSTLSQAYFNRALLRSQIGDYNRAMEDYNRASLLSPENVIVYYNRAHLLAQQGNFVDAYADFSKAIELYPDFARAYEGRASVSYLMNNRAGYESDTETAKTIIADYHSRLGSGDFVSLADTSRTFDRLVSFDSQPGGAAATGGRASTLTLLPMFRYSYMRERSGMQPMPVYAVAESEEFMRTIGNPRLELVNTASNLAADTLMTMDTRLSQAVFKDDASWQRLFERGVSQMLIRQYTGSLNSYTAAIDIDPSNPFLYFNRSAVQSEMTDFISSIDNSYGRYNMDNDLTGRSTSVTRTYNYDIAIADLNKAAKLLPDFAYIYYNRGILYYKSAMAEEALADFDRAVGLNPNFAEAYYNRGILHIVMNDTKAGIADLSKAGELGISEAYEVIRLYSNDL